MKKGYTKDEIYLIRLHKMAIECGDETAEIDRYKVGRAVGMNDRAVDAATQHLLKANFLKKGEGNALYLTSNGLHLIKILMDT